MKTNNKAITVFLILLLLGIWGTVVYQLFIAGPSAEPGDNVKAVNDQVATRNTPIRYEYRANVRDPFDLIVPVQKKIISKKITPAPQSPPWTPPPFKLTGIVLNDKKRTAMLESNDGSIYFLREGDSLGTLKIRSIRQSVVAYSYLNGNGVWNIER